MLALVRNGRWVSPFRNRRSEPQLRFSFYTTAALDESKPSRPSPPPIRVSLTGSAGRGVFATRMIRAGELVHTAKPVVSHPALSVTTSVCYSCLRKVKSNSTSKAVQGVLFCSEECEQHSKDTLEVKIVQPNISSLFNYLYAILSQGVLSLGNPLVFYQVEKQADWSTFHDYCRTQGLKYPLLAKRLACMVVSGVAAADSLDILQPAILSTEMILQMEKEFLLLRTALEEAYIRDEQLAFLTEQWYIGVLARIRINAFRVELAGGSYDDLISSAAALIEAEAAVGNAVYMLPSFYNHDCDPNTHILWIENTDARVKALCDIEAGEEMRICYIDASMDHDTRQAILSKGFGFECHCLRCSSGD